MGLDISYASTSCKSSQKLSDDPYLMSHGMLVPGTGHCPALKKQVKYFLLIWVGSHPSTPIHPALVYIILQHLQCSVEDSHIILPSRHTTM